MVFRRQMPTSLLATLLGRLAISLSAGIGMRKAWASEMQRVPARWRGALAEVAEALGEGGGLAAGMERAGRTFPQWVQGMVAVGEQTGHEAETLRDLSKALDHSARTTRALLGSLIRPGLQLLVALAVVGFLILLAGALRDERGAPLDMLGLGLVGTAGLTTYLVCLGVLVVLMAVAGRALLASWRFRGPVRWIVDRLPVVGAASRAAEAAAWCRAASLASAAGLPAGRLVSLASLAAPGNTLDPARFEESLRRGATLTDSLRTTGLFSDRLLAGVSIGEATGTTAEVLDRLAGEFDDEARRGLEAAAQGVGFLIWAMVAGLIIVLIFRIFSFYVATLQGLTKGR